MYQNVWLEDKQESQLSIWCWTFHAMTRKPRNAINVAFAFQSIALRFAAHRMYLSMLEGHVHSIWDMAEMGVSKNNGTPKSSILIGFSIINHPFWGPTPIFGNTQMELLDKTRLTSLVRFRIASFLVHTMTHTSLLCEEYGVLVSLDQRYCWWLKSCTTWDVWNPINNGINYL